MKNNFITKIIGATLAFAMMIGGAVGINAAKQAKEVNAATINGTFNKYSGAITEGDYVIASTTYTLGNTISSGRFANGRTNLTNGAASISNPDEKEVWHIAPNGNYWTLYNSAVGKYAAGNGSKNSGSMIDSITDYARWTVTGTTTYQFENLGRANGTSNTGNKWLRNNTTSGWAPYATSTGGALTIYKKVVSSFGTLHHIAVRASASKLLFETGETFSSSGLTLTGYDGENEETANTQVYTSGYETDYDNHVFVRSDVGENKTVTVTYNGKTTTYTITVVPGPDFVHTYENNSVFGSNSFSTTDTVTHTPTSGPEYITLGGYNYSKNQTQSMSLANTEGAYFGNNEEYELDSVKKNINKIIITTNSDVSEKVAMTEGPIPLSEDTAVEPTLSNNNKTLTYEFSGNNPFFKFKSTSAWYINMTSISIYLGSNATVATVTDVVAGIKEGTYLTGSTLSASDFDVLVSWSNGNVTEPTSGFTWTVRGLNNAALIEGDNEVILTYQGVESDPFNVVGTSIHATAVTIQEENSITLMVGKTITLHATVTPSNNMDSTVWSSNNISVASVSDAGVVTANAIGVATITITVGSVSASCQIIVSAPAKASYSLIKVGSTSAYANSSDVTFSDGKIWNIPGNQTLNDGLKLGGNLKEGATRAMYSKSAYENVEFLTITHGIKDDVVDVDSLKLLVYSTAANAASGNEGNADDVVSGVYVENGTTTFTPSSSNAWENKYFRVAYNLSSSTTSNKGIILKKLEIGLPNPSNCLQAASSIKTISGVESNEGATVTNVALRFGGIIPVSDWNTINSSWPITDFGIMFARGSMLTARSLDSLEKVFRNDPADVAMVHRGAVGTPNANGDDYIFTARLNLEEVDYDEVFYAAPFIVAGGEYYFLQEMHYSVRTLAEECLTSGESTLSQAALTTLKGNN